jgi:hypothetical protein
MTTNADTHELANFDGDITQSFDYHVNGYETDHFTASTANAEMNELYNSNCDIAPSLNHEVELIWTNHFTLSAEVADNDELSNSPWGNTLNTNDHIVDQELIWFSGTAKPLTPGKCLSSRSTTSSP